MSKYAEFRGEFDGDDENSSKLFRIAVFDEILFKQVEKSTFQGYIPLSLIPLGGPMVRERGIPERINRTALDAMMAPGPLGDAIVSLLLFPRRPAPPSSGGIGSAGPGEKNVGG